MNYLRHVLDHLRKDLRLEWRSRDSINGMLFFALLVVVVFGLAFDPTSYPTTTRQISGGGARTILLTTHQAALAKPLAANILTMRNGQILDSPGEAAE